MFGRPKKESVPVPEEPKEPVKASEPAPSPEAEQLAPEVEYEHVEEEIPFPFFEGARVEEVIQPDLNGQWHRCKMSDGTTKDVPTYLFTVAKRIPKSPSA